MPQTQSAHAPNSSAQRTPRGDRACQVPSCTKKACHAAFGNTKIPSRYCYKHTCPKVLPVEDGYHCPTPTREGEIYCDKHMRCAGPDCREIGEYREDVTAIWYCQRHRCEKDGCKGGAHDALTRRCTEHQECAAPGCEARPDSIAFSSFCFTHTCTFDDACSNQAVANKRCREHAEQTKNTEEPPRPLPNSRVNSFSEKQHKCAKDGCNVRKMRSNDKFCLDHGCRIDKCDGEQAESCGRLCADHKCTADKCYNAITAVDQNGNLALFCSEHACRDPDCHLFGMKRPSSFCEKHTCKAADCFKRTTNGPNSFCDAHRLRPCKVDGCRFPAMGNDVYCKNKHGCIETGCQKARLSFRMGDLEPGEEDYVRCLPHDREWYLKQRREDEKLSAGVEKLNLGQRSPMQATVEDDTEDDSEC